MNYHIYIPHIYIFVLQESLHIWMALFCCLYGAHKQHLNQGKCVHVLLVCDVCMCCWCVMCTCVAGVSRIHTVIRLYMLAHITYFLPALCGECCWCVET